MRMLRGRVGWLDGVKWEIGLEHVQKGETLGAGAGGSEGMIANAVIMKNEDSRLCRHHHLPPCLDPPLSCPPDSFYTHVHVGSLADLTPHIDHSSLAVPCTYPSFSSSNHRLVSELTSSYTLRHPAPSHHLSPRQDDWILPEQADSQASADHFSTNSTSPAATSVVNKTAAITFLAR